MSLHGRRIPEAEAAFAADPRWVGGDDAYSIQLSPGRRLWLFGDSFVEPVDGTRATASFINNSIAIQTGEVLEPGSLAFHWGRTPAGEPTAFFPGEAPDYLWPGHGAMVGGVLVLFFMVTRDREWRRTSDDQIETLEFFDSHDWTARVVANPHDHPSAWLVTPAVVPDSSPAPLVGSAGVLVHDGHLYAHAVDHPRARLCRWDVEAATAGHLGAPEWWGGDRGWTRDADAAVVTVEPAETEFTVHWDADAGCFLRTQLLGLVGRGIQVSAASEIQGPWSDAVVADHRIDTDGRPHSFSYSGKAHPGLRVPGGTAYDLVATHNTITHALADIATTPDLYTPRVIGLMGRLTT